MGWRIPCSGLGTGSLSVFDTWAADRERWVTGGEAGGEARYPWMAQGYQLTKTADWGPGAASHCPGLCGEEGRLLEAHQGKPWGGKLYLSAKKNFLTKLSETGIDSLRR